MARLRLTVPPSNNDEFNFKVRYDVPLPVSKQKRNVTLYKFLDTIEVGGSFVISDTKKFEKIYAAVGHYGKKTNKIFARRQTEEGPGLWRIK